MKASLVMVMVLLVGFAHLSSKQQLQQGRSGVNDLVAEVPFNKADGLTGCQFGTNCPICSSAENLNTACPATMFSCEQQIAAGVSTLTENIQTQAYSPSAAAVSNCNAPVAMNAWTFELSTAVAACS